MQKGKHEEALKELEKTEEAAKRAKTNDISLNVQTLKGLIMQTIGAYEEALEIHSLALKTTEELLSKDPDNKPYQSSLQMNLDEIFKIGNRFYKMGRFLQAKNCYELHLLISQKLLETDNENVTYQSSVAMTLNNLASLLSDMGRIEDAKAKYEKALEIYEKLLQNDPENVAYQSYVGGTLNNLGNLLKNMGRIEDAKAKYEKALEIYTEPMQYLTIGRKSESIIRLIQLNSEQADKETNPFNQMNYLREAFQICKEHQEFFIKYELKHERKLVTEAGLSAYIDFLMKNVSLEGNFEKRAKEYEKALQAVEKLEEIEDDETVLKLCSSAACYLRGRKLVNEALASRQPELELLRQAVEQFKSAKETYDKANVCFCVYTGLLKILEGIEELEEVDVPKLKELIQKVVENLPEDVNPSIRVSFENIPQIFEEKDKMTRKELLKELDDRVSAIEYKALENFFGHVNAKIKDYFEEPFSPNLIYENWKLKVIFDDPEKVKGKLTIKVGDKTLLNRTLTPEEVKNNLLEIDYLKIGYFPQGEDEIYFTTLGQKKPVIRSSDYFESVGRDNKTRIFQYDCCNGVCVDRDLQIAAVQLKYHVYGENSVVKLTVDDAYHRKVMAVLDAVKGEEDIVVFPEFSIPFDYLGEIQEYADENGIIVVAGSHYVTEGKLGEYGKQFCREFEEGDLRKNISPVVIQSSKIVHNEKLLGAKEERELYFDEGMKAGKVNHIFRLRDNLNVGVMICYEYLNSDLRQRLIPACDIMLVPQTNPKPERFYETAKGDLNNPLCSGNKAYVMANGIFTLGDDKKILGGSTGIVSTLDKYSYKRQDEGIITPVDKVMEQFILMTSINTGFSSARDTQLGQVPLKTKIVHIFEENEILSSSENEGRRFIQLLETIENCKNKEELREILNREENKATIKTFSPLMHKHIQDLKELTLDEMKKKCCCILIPAE
ncbi:MAG: tetratricopeptide repeat protein [Methanosarcina sp.]|uniref:tetratricopeptide repeat protein n=1 Tax=Methanosarcina sp. TaxID=2213 RepID=UPI0026283FA7|nr:tetratricopeptide repeat protein [Methanosarcina sp.]MDD3245554.1 tetratricopeptide repeat protein [Methanosarcina sp.]MDD4247855.1 tetratricopeptide repeat protein [Methanosarcina sp.]